jgi:hypothetical protein
MPSGHLENKRCLYRATAIKLVLLLKKYKENEFRPLTLYLHDHVGMFNFWTCYKVKQQLFSEGIS